MSAPAVAAPSICEAELIEVEKLIELLVNGSVKIRKRAPEQHRRWWWGCPSVAHPPDRAVETIRRLIARERGAR